MNSLPAELICKILGDFSGPEDVERCRQVSRRFRSIIDNDTSLQVMQKYWRLGVRPEVDARNLSARERWHNLLSQQDTSATKLRHSGSYRGIGQEFICAVNDKAHAVQNYSLRDLSARVIATCDFRPHMSAKFTETAFNPFTQWAFDVSENVLVLRSRPEWVLSCLADDAAGDWPTPNGLGDSGHFHEELSFWYLDPLEPRLLTGRTGRPLRLTRCCLHSTRVPVNQDPLSLRGDWLVVGNKGPSAHASLSMYRWKTAAQVQQIYLDSDENLLDAAMVSSWCLLLAVAVGPEDSALGSALGGQPVIKSYRLSHGTFRLAHIFEFPILTAAARIQSISLVPSPVSLDHHTANGKNLADGRGIVSVQIVLNLGSNPRGIGRAFGGAFLISAICNRKVTEDANPFVEWENWRESFYWTGETHSIFLPAVFGYRIMILGKSKSDVEENTQQEADCVSIVDLNPHRVQQAMKRSAGCLNLASGFDKKSSVEVLNRNDGLGKSSTSIHPCSSLDSYTAEAFGNDSHALLPGSETLFKAASFLPTAEFDGRATWPVLSLMADEKRVFLQQCMYGSSDLHVFEYETGQDEKKQDVMESETMLASEAEYLSDSDEEVLVNGY